ncbi:MAG: DUF4876 domain-containing protein [Calditrichia bacterium]
MKNILLFIMVSMILIFVYCEQHPQMPLKKDREVSATIVAIDTSGSIFPEDSSRLTPVKGAIVELNSKDYNQKFRFETDSAGKVEIQNVLAATYEVNIWLELTRNLTLKGDMLLSLYDYNAEADTVMLHPETPAPIVIHEIYYCGPVNNIFFFFDQYIELYNRDTATVYLDGMIIARIRSSTEILPYIDSLDYVQTVYAYQFPGLPGGTQYPVEPGSFVVIASDAFDHTQSLPNAVDLSQADFEFYNEYKNDWDNLNVPNLVSLNPSRGTDFLISLASDGVVLADGTSWELVTVTTSSGENEYVNLPISTIVDGVEYKSGVTTNKYLTYRIDSGFAGIGVTKYSGKSVQRVVPWQDTNNSTVDFRVLNAPTPGGP